MLKITSRPRLLIYPGTFFLQDRSEKRKGASRFIHTAAVDPDALLGQGVPVGLFHAMESAAKIGNACQFAPGEPYPGKYGVWRT